MALQLHWFLPSHGDGWDLAERRDHKPGAKVTRRKPDLGYLAQVARAADQLGFAGMLTPTGLFCEDAWVVAAALAAQTNRVKFMIALRPGLMSPLVAGQMAATFQRISGDRLLLNVVTGGEADEQRRYGDWLDHDSRYDRTEEFLDLLDRLWPGDPVDFDGTHFRHKAALLARPPAVPPPIFLGGSSPAARRVAGRLADVYLAWGETPGELGVMFDEVRKRAAEHGRTLQLGTRFNVISRDSADEAWQAAERLLRGLEPQTIEAAQRRFARTESEGQRRMAALHGGDAGKLVVYPNVWMGFGLARPGAGAALVGSHEEVAERIAEYHAAGADHLILSGQPHLEEAYSFAEGVMPLLRRRGILEPS
ncbi:LLM class flavin-dependent oxidoreductase [Nonomuraea sp. NPDC046802]|uniref:LLM class flavin-dependent oxidoreductase n=1 Tax=Nonomuraea sp. NPDC046802 TaxID=3154919 RepID=UPI0033FF631B